MSSDSARGGERLLARFHGIAAMALAVALGGGAAGCAPPMLSLAADADPPGISYGKTFDRWSRVGRIISFADLDTPVVITATLRSRSFQRAYADRYTQAFKITDPAEQAKIIERERAAGEPGLSFWLRTSCHSYQWNDLKPAANKWRVALIDEAGQQTDAESVEPLAFRDMTQQALLGDPPDLYTKLWLVRFPAQRSDGQPLIQPGARKIILRAAGPVGQTDLTWLLN